MQVGVEPTNLLPLWNCKAGAARQVWSPHSILQRALPAKACMWTCLFIAVSLGQLPAVLGVGDQTVQLWKGT